MGVCGLRPCGGPAHCLLCTIVRRQELVRRNQRNGLQVLSSPVAVLQAGLCSCSFDACSAVGCYRVLCCAVSPMKWLQCCWVVSFVLGLAVEAQMKEAAAHSAAAVATVLGTDRE